MKTSAEFKTGRQFIARLLPGKDLIESLREFCEEKGITAGYIPMMIGAVKSMEFYRVNSRHEIIPEKYEGSLELSGQGTIAMKEGELDFHLHVVGATHDQKETIMGHFLSGEIPILIEVVIVEIEGIDMIKQVDQAVFPAPVLFFRDK